MNKELQEKNENIISSVRYAARLQKAILPSLSLLDKEFSDYFLIYKPKDIVCGDFYWVTYYKDILFLAVGDCTGHGVPGAIISFIAINTLNKIVKDHNILDPGEILNKARQEVIKLFEQKEYYVKDGFDIVLCAVKGNTLKMAAAYNSLLLVRNGELFEYKGQRQPIGLVQIGEPEEFKTITIELNSGDKLYFASDGFKDQPGGPNSKKLSSKRFKSLLLNISHIEPMKKQKTILERFYEAWKGDNEQIDDIIILGVKKR